MKNCHKFKYRITFFYIQLVQGAKQPIGAIVTIQSRTVDKWYTDHRGSQGKLERKISFHCNVLKYGMYNDSKQC